jgi:hypothetical protein
MRPVSLIASREGLIGDEEVEVAGFEEDNDEDVEGGESLAASMTAE